MCLVLYIILLNLTMIENRSMVSDARYQNAKMAFHRWKKLRFWEVICPLSLRLGMGLDFQFVVLLQEGGLLPEPKSGHLSNTQKWIVWGDTCADKVKDFIGKGHTIYWEGREQQGKGAQENCSAMWLAVSGFMVMVLVSWLCLANHLSWLIVWLRFLPGGVHISQPRWMPVRRILGDWSSPPSFVPSRILQVSFQWQHHVPYRNFLLWDNSGKWAWPKQVVSVNSSLRTSPLRDFILKILLGN